MDAFFVAFKLPNLLRRLFAEGAFSQAFVPILGEYKNKRGAAEARLLSGGSCGDPAGAGAAAGDRRPGVTRGAVTGLFPHRGLRQMLTNSH